MRQPLFSRGLAALLLALLCAGSAAWAALAAPPQSGPPKETLSFTGSKTVLAAFPDPEGLPPVTERELVAKARWGDIVVAAVRLTTPTEASASRSTLVFGAMDLDSSRLVGQTYSVSGYDTWCDVVQRGDGVAVQYLAIDDDGQGGYACSGGGLRFGSNGWDILWPAPQDSGRYEDYWSERYLGQYLSVPAAVERTEVLQGPGSRYHSHWTNYLSQDLPPLLQAKGITVLAYEMTGIQPLGTLAQDPLDPLTGRYLIPIQVVSLQYRLLVRDFQAAWDAGFLPEGDSGWVVPDPAVTGLPVALFIQVDPDQEPTLLTSFTAMTDDGEVILEQARALLLDAPPLPSGDGIPTLTGTSEERYDPETGLYHHDGLDITLRIPDAFRDLVAFRTAVLEDGSAQLTVSCKPLWVRHEAQGGQGDGTLYEVRVLDEAQYQAYRAEQGPPYWNEFTRPNNISLSVPVFDQGRFYVDLPGGLAADPGDLCQSALVLQAQKAAGLISQSFSPGGWLPMDVDFSLVLYPDDRDAERLDRVGVGTLGPIPLGDPLTAQTSTRLTRSEGDYWLKETWEGLTAVSYVEGATGRRTVTGLSTTSPWYTTYRRGICVGANFIEGQICYDGSDYGEALPQPPDQVPGASPTRFSITRTGGGIPLPGPYWLEFYGADGQISEIRIYADLTQGEDPFTP